MPARALSDAERKARGTHPSARSIKPVRNSAGVTTQISGAMLSPEPPKGFTGDAKEAWVAAVTNAPPGTLLATDVAVLERWCRNYAMYRRVTKALEHSDIVVADDNGNLKVSAEFTVMQALDSALLKLEKELGFTPCARARVRAREPEPESTNPFETLENE